MKKKISILLMFLLLTACIVGEGAVLAKESYEFVFIPKCVHPWYETVRKGAEQAAAEFAERGIEINVKFNAAAECKVTQFVEKIESTIASKPDGIAIACLDEQAAISVINEGIEFGVPIMTFDTDAPNSNRISFVGETYETDLRKGAACAEILAEKIGYKGEVAVLIGSPTAAGHRGRTEGFKEKMKEYPDIKIVADLADEDDVEKAIKLTEDAIKAYPNIKGFYGVDASNPFGAAKAIEAAGKTGEIFVVSTADMPDTIRYMRKGIIVGGTLLKPWEDGYWAVYYLYAINNGLTVPALHETGYKVLTPDMLDSIPKYDAPEYQL